MMNPDDSLEAARSRARDGQTGWYMFIDGFDAEAVEVFDDSMAHARAFGEDVNVTVHVHHHHDGISNAQMLAQFAASLKRTIDLSREVNARADGFAFEIVGMLN